MFGASFMICGASRRISGASRRGPDCAPRLEGLAEDPGCAEPVGTLEAPDCAPFLDTRRGPRLRHHFWKAWPNTTHRKRTTFGEPGPRSAVRGTRRNPSEPGGTRRGSRLRTTFGELQIRGTRRNPSQPVGAPALAPLSRGSSPEISIPEVFCLHSAPSTVDR